MRKLRVSKAESATKITLLFSGNSALSLSALLTMLRGAGLDLGDRAGRQEVSAMLA